MPIISNNEQFTCLFHVGLLRLPVCEDDYFLIFQKKTKPNYTIIFRVVYTERIRIRIWNRHCFSKVLFKSMWVNLNYCPSVRIFQTGYCTNNKVLMRHKHTKYERNSYRKIYWTKWLRWWWLLTQFLHKVSTALAIYPAEKRLDYVSLGLLAKFATWWLKNDFLWGKIFKSLYNFDGMRNKFVTISSNGVYLWL